MSTAIIMAQKLSVGAFVTWSVLHFTPLLFYSIFPYDLDYAVFEIIIPPRKQ